MMSIIYNKIFLVKNYDLLTQNLENLWLVQGSSTSRLVDLIYKIHQKLLFILLRHMILC